MKLLTLCESILEARSPKEYEVKLAQAAQALSCANFGGYLLDRSDGLRGARFWQFNNVSTEHHAKYYDPDANRVDPVMRHVKDSSLPLVWTQGTYAAVGLADLWDEQAAWGARSGISIGLHLQGGRHFGLGFETPDRWRESNPENARMLSDFLLITAYAQVAAGRLFGEQAPPVGALSPRELEVLKWTAAGKTAWETGVILSISESTVNKHIDAATRRLQCTSKLHAVVVALRAGLL